MTEVSVNTEALETLAGQYEEINENDELTVLVEQTKVHDDVWPAISTAGLKETYDDLEERWPMPSKPCTASRKRSARR